MASRDTSIALSESEKSKLDKIAEDAFGESDTVPYGVTVSYLVDNFECQRV